MTEANEAPKLVELDQSGPRLRIDDLTVIFNYTIDDGVHLMPVPFEEMHGRLDHVSTAAYAEMIAGFFSRFEQDRPMNEIRLSTVRQQQKAAAEAEAEAILEASLSPAQKRERKAHLETEARKAAQAEKAAAVAPPAKKVSGSPATKS